MFHPELDFAAIHAAYAADQRVRVPAFLTLDSAVACLQALQQASYQLAFVSDGKNYALRPAELNALPSAQRQALAQQTQADATKGVGFIYSRCQINGNAEAPPALQQLHAWLNSPEVLEWVRACSGYTDIVAASAQGTRYSAGQYLTRHRDEHPDEQRRLAYVINLSPEWHPDWGGLLQFYSDDGTPRDAWAPVFNSLSLFDVKHVHAVTYVAPFARQPRYAVTGWFRATPL